MSINTKVSLARVSGVIGDTLGLHFPEQRWPDLQRGLTEAADEFGFSGLAECVDWLTAAPLTPAQLQVLAAHLTIGETHFFREKKTFDVLRYQILPELIRSRRGRDQRLRIWSAACSTGEEAYSLAILLQQLLPDPNEWQLKILATDVNGQFLRKAVAGSYRESSFRDVGPGFKETYFRKNGDGSYLLVPEIREMVTFAHLNLVEDVYPSFATDTNAMDVILCRNVLIDFPQEQVLRVADKLHRSVVEGGWLAVSPSEASQANFPKFVARNYPGAILYQKSARAHDLDALPEHEGKLAYLRASQTHARAWAQPAPSRIPPRSPAGDTPDVERFACLARGLANDGRLDDARTWCERWIAADTANFAAHYLRAIVLLEQGSPGDARESLQRAISLQPDFILAHLALGNVARRRGAATEADRHFRNTLALLSRFAANEVIPESDGLTAGRLKDTVTTQLIAGAQR